MPKIDVDAVLAAKAPRIARWVPGFVIRWLKRTIHQNEINYILDEYSALPPQQFIQACFKFWGVTYSVEGLENLDPKIDPKLNLTANVAQKRDVKCVLSNTFGFGGHNSSVVFKKI